MSDASARLAALSSEGEGPAVVLCHGNSQRASQFQGVLESALGRRYRLVAFDLPGHGASPDMPERYSVDGLADALIDAIAAHGLERPVLVGHSLGGHLAIRVAERFSIAGLFVFGTPPSRSLADLGTKLKPGAGELLFAGPLDDAQLDAVASLLVPGGGEPRRRVRQAVARTDPRVRLGVASSAAAAYADELAILTALEAPFAVVHGRGDTIVTDAWTQEQQLAGMWRGAVQQVAGGHMPHLLATDELVALLSAFLTDALGDAPPSSGVVS